MFGLGSVTFWMRATVVVAALGGLVWVYLWIDGRGYDRGYAERSKEIAEATDELNDALTKIDRLQRERANEILEAERERDELERELAAERAASDDDSAWALERVLRYNRASGPE